MDGVPGHLRGPSSNSSSSCSASTDYGDWGVHERYGIYSYFLFFRVMFCPAIHSSDRRGRPARPRLSWFSTDQLCTHTCSAW
jgi:hypothetical protein